MNTEAMTKFLSRESISAHVEHLKNEQAKYRVLEKSIDGLNGKTISEISRISLPREEKAEIMKANVYIQAHKCYFSSFTEEPKPSSLVRKYYGSEDNLCYELFLLSREASQDFILISLDGRGRLKVTTLSECPYEPLYYDVRLALDLYEHSYFSDYGFNRDNYVRSALASLDLSRLDLSK